MKFPPQLDEVSPIYTKTFNDNTLLPTTDMSPFGGHALLGAMRLGSNSLAHNDPLEFSKDGLTMIVRHQPVTDNSNDASRTLYAVSKPQLPNQGPPPFPPARYGPSEFALAPYLRAELEFDMPNSISAIPPPENHPGPRPSLNTWAVVLNFKSGDETDGSDLGFGGVCKFKNGGNVAFHETNSPVSNLLGDTTYADFASNQTMFSFAVQINRDAMTATGFTTLNVSGQVSFKTPLSGLLNLTDAAQAANPISAVGITVVNQGAPQPFSTVLVRIRSFVLYCVLLTPKPS
jgi:hypothetical protein